MSPGLSGSELVEPQPQAVECPRLEVLDEDVGARRQVARLRPPSSGGQVDRRPKLLLRFTDAK